MGLYMCLMSKSNVSKVANYLESLAYIYHPNVMAVKFTLCKYFGASWGSLSVFLKCDFPSLLVSSKVDYK